MLAKLPLPRFQQPGPGPPLQLEPEAVRELDQQRAVRLQLTVAQRQRAPRLEKGRERVEGKDDKTMKDDILQSMPIAVDCPRNRSESWPSSRSTVQMTTFWAGR